MRVVEEGFSQMREWPGTGVSVGAMVQNTSGLVAYGATAAFRLLDAKGTDIGDSTDGSWRTVRIPVIMPGDRIPVGTGLRVDTTRQADLSSVQQVANVEITLTVAQWWAPDNSVIRFSAVRANNVVLKAPRTEVDFSTVSPYCDWLAGRGAAVVFRDRTGRIIGGGVEPAMLKGPGVCPVGNYAKWSLFGDLIVHAEELIAGAASADAAAYCDFVQRDGSFVEAAPRAFRPVIPQSPKPIN